MIIRPFRIQITPDQGNEIEEFLINNGIICSSHIYPFTNIVFKGGVEYFTSNDKWYCDKYPDDWEITYPEFISEYIEVKKQCRVVHHKKEPYDVLICRPSKYGNPYSHKANTLAEFKVNTREEAVAAYRTWITIGDGKHLLNDLFELKGKTLGCWCSPLKCHGDVLVDLVNQIK